MVGVGSGRCIPAWVGTVSVVPSPGDRGGFGRGGALGCPPSPLGTGPRSRVGPRPPPRASSALSPQVAAVGEVLGFGQQPAALGCQSRRAQGGDGGGGQQSGDLQGTRGGGVAPCWAGGSSASRVPRKTFSLSSYPFLHPLLTPLPGINPPGLVPMPKDSLVAVGDAQQPSRTLPVPLSPSSVSHRSWGASPFPGDLSQQEPASSAPSAPSPGTETYGKRRRVPRPQVPPRPRHPPPPRGSTTHPAGHVGWEKHPSEGGHGCRRFRHGPRDSAINPTGNFVRF